MTDDIYNSIVNSSYNVIETENVEINEQSSADSKRKENEIEKYNLILKGLGKDLRCRCCGDVYSDPVKLKCEHLIDRSCAVIKNTEGVIECPTCHHPTICDNVDKLLTDIDFSSRIPCKPDSLLEIINNHGGQLMKLNRERNDESNECVEDCYGRSKHIRKRKRKSRWDSVYEQPKTSFTDAIMEILSSHNLPKNITMSQFKKFTEISSKSSIMSLLTKAVLQGVNEKVQEKNNKKSDEYSDSEIQEMISSQKIGDLFELENAQFKMLYRDALDKGAIYPQSNDKSPKPPLLPIPTSEPDEAVKTAFSPESPKIHLKESPEKVYSPNSEKNNIFFKSAIDKPFSKTVPNDLSLGSPPKKLSSEPNQNYLSPESPTKHFSLQSSDTDAYDKTSFTNSNVSKTSHIADPECSGKLESKKENSPNILSELRCSPEIKKENISEENTQSKVVAQIDESVQYRESVHRLHSIYSNMYLASLKLKEFEKQTQAPEYLLAYKAYSENYTEYQKLYSSLQSITKSENNIAENSCEHHDVIANAHYQEQASSTISPGGYAPDSTESCNDNAKHKPVNYQLQINTNVRTSLSPNLQEQTKNTSTDNTDKFGYLWISNLCKEARTSDLCQLFGKFGHVSKIKLFQYNALTPMTFFSLIIMSTDKEAEAAYKELHNTVLFERPLHIKLLDHDPLSIDRSV